MSFVGELLVRIGRVVMPDGEELQLAKRHLDDVSELLAPGDAGALAAGRALIEGALVTGVLGYWLIIAAASQQRHVLAAMLALVAIPAVLLFPALKLRSALKAKLYRRIASRARGHMLLESAGHGATSAAVSSSCKLTAEASAAQRSDR